MLRAELFQLLPSLRSRHADFASPGIEVAIAPAAFSFSVFPLLQPREGRRNLATGATRGPGSKRIPRLICAKPASKRPLRRSKEQVASSDDPLLLPCSWPPASGSQIMHHQGTKVPKLAETMDAGVWQEIGWSMVDDGARVSRSQIVLRPSARWPGCFSGLVSCVLNSSVFGSLPIFSVFQNQLILSILVPKTFANFEPSWCHHPPSLPCRPKSASKQDQLDGCDTTPVFIGMSQVWGHCSARSIFRISAFQCIRVSC